MQVTGFPIPEAKTALPAQQAITVLTGARQIAKPLIVLRIMSWTGILKPYRLIAVRCKNHFLRPAAPGSRCRVRGGAGKMQAFAAMFEYHRPDVWIFGHWHRSASAVVDGTRFQCLGELRTCMLSWWWPGGPVRLYGGSEYV